MVYSHAHIPHWNWLKIYSVCIRDPSISPYHSCWIHVFGCFWCHFIDIQLSYGGLKLKSVVCALSRDLPEGKIQSNPHTVHFPIEVLLLALFLSLSPCLCVRLSLSLPLDVLFFRHYDMMVCGIYAKSTRQNHQILRHIRLNLVLVTQSPSEYHTERWNMANISYKTYP